MDSLPALVRITDSVRGPRWAVQAAGAIHELADKVLAGARLVEVAARAGADPLSIAATPALSGDADVRLLAPVDGQEVWAAGVTYERSRAARVAETTIPDVYDRVYVAPRPELFFKATSSRIVGPGGAVGVRTDAAWSVPEPELAVVFGPDLSVIGFTIGDDVTARDIEGENPLYLPQAKVFPGCCALGPGIVLGLDRAELPRLAIGCEIVRSGAVVWSGTTGSERIVRSLRELANFLAGCGPFEEGVILLTGTGMVPPDDVSLLDGDRVHIVIEGLGELDHGVRQVAPIGG